MKKLEFFQRQLDAKDPQIFRATVLDVRNYGLLVELPDVLLTGLVHVSSLTGRLLRLRCRPAAPDRPAIAPTVLPSATSCGFSSRGSTLQTPGRLRDRRTKEPAKTERDRDADPVVSQLSALEASQEATWHIAGALAQNLLPFPLELSRLTPAQFTNGQHPRSQRVQIERKHFHVELRENERGKFLRITEEAHGRRNTIIVPSTGVDDFTAAIGEVLGRQRAALAFVRVPRDLNAAATRVALTR